MKLPPLNALRAFEAAGRHGSFVKAGDEMHVSPAAISRHVKRLEMSLALTLFDRRAQGLALTEVGRRLLPEISNAFQRISDATLSARTMSSELRVLCAPTLAMRWLMPRLSRFHELHPNIRVSVGLFIEREQVSEATYDAGISAGWWLDDLAAKSTERRVLRYERLAPVCSPGQASRSPRLRTPFDLRDRPLLHTLDTTDWDAWLAAVGETRISVRQGRTYRTGDAAAGAAIAGEGVAIVDLDLYKYELDSGQLVAPFDFVLSNASPIVFFCARQRLAEPAISLFLEWLEVALRE
jgi:LysR family glycine cleavage system transcriptional activator